MLLLLLGCLDTIVRTVVSLRCASRIDCLMVENLRLPWLQFISTSENISVCVYVCTACANVLFDTENILLLRIKSFRLEFVAWSLLVNVWNILWGLVSKHFALSPHYKYINNTLLHKIWKRATFDYWRQRQISFDCAQTLQITKIPQGLMDDNYWKVIMEF